MSNGTYPSEGYKRIEFIGDEKPYKVTVVRSNGHAVAANVFLRGGTVNVPREGFLALVDLSGNIIYVKSEDIDVITIVPIQLMEVPNEQPKQEKETNGDKQSEGKRKKPSKASRAKDTG